MVYHLQFSSTFYFREPLRRKKVSRDLSDMHELIILQSIVSKNVLKECVLLISPFQDDPPKIAAAALLCLFVVPLLDVQSIKANQHQGSVDRNLSRLFFVRVLLCLDEEDTPGDKLEVFEVEDELPWRSNERLVSLSIPPPRSISEIAPENLWVPPLNSTRGRGKNNQTKHIASNTLPIKYGIRHQKYHDRSGLLIISMTRITSVSITRGVSSFVGWVGRASNGFRPSPSSTTRWWSNPNIVPLSFVWLSTMWDWVIWACQKLEPFKAALIWQYTSPSAMVLWLGSTFVRVWIKERWQKLQSICSTFIVAQINWSSQSQEIPQDQVQCRV